MAGDKRLTRLWPHLLVWGAAIALYLVLVLPFLLVADLDRETFLIGRLGIRPNEDLVGYGRLSLHFFGAPLLVL